MVNEAYLYLHPHCFHTTRANLLRDYLTNLMILNRARRMQKNQIEIIKGAEDEKQPKM